MERYDRAVWFFTVSLLVPWLCWFAAGYLSHQPALPAALANLAAALGILGLVAPVLVAAWLFQERGLWGDLRGRLLRLGGFPRIYLFYAAFLIFAALVVAQLLSLLFGHGLDQFALASKTSFTAGALPPWFILLLAPVVEELAWHTYGTDALRRRLNLFWTSIVFAVYWVLWHLPLAGIKGYYQSNLVQEGWLYSLNFAVGLFVFVILMNWLYYKTGRSVVVAILFHLSANVSNEIFTTDPDSKVIETALLLVVCIVVLARERCLFFSSEFPAAVAGRLE